MKEITTYTTPVMQDVIVQEYNALLTSIVEYRYGIAHIGQNEDGATYPQIYYNDGGRKSMMLFPDNKVKSFCFWEFDRADILDDDEGVNYNLSFVFWGNLTRIDGTKYYDFTSELEQSIIKLFVAKGATDISYTQEDVFSGYSKYKENEKQTLMRPNTGFKISMNIHSFIC